MVFRRRAKTPAEQLADKDLALYEKRWGWNYIKKHFKNGDRVYSPLYDVEFEITYLEAGDHWLFYEEDDDSVMFQPFEVVKC